MRVAGVVLISVFLCATNRLWAQYMSSRALPHVLVYKTKADYRDLVPVMLSGDKAKIVSYPAPGDIKTGSGYALPVLLHKGYLLDRRGIAINAAFTKFTYEDYGSLQEVPAMDELYGAIVDKNPLVALYDCGIRDNNTNSVGQLNKIIDHRQLNKKCKRIK